VYQVGTNKGIDIGVFLKKSVAKIQVSLNADKNNGCFSHRPLCIYDNTSLNVSYNDKCFRQN